MSTHRMPTFDACQCRVATCAELVDRLVEHKLIFSGMGIMAGNTAHSKYNAMDIGHRVFFVKQLLFIFMAGKTKIKGTFCPELIPVLAPMGIMAKGASSDKCPVAMFT